MERSELLRFARVGAEARLEALQREIASIRQAFPHLAGARQPRPTPTRRACGAPLRV